MTGISRRSFINSGLVAGGVAAFPSSLSASQPLKVGFVYPSPISDFGWSYRHEVGRQEVQDHFGDLVETSFVENVAEGADSRRVITQLAITGHNLIFTCSFGYMDPTIEVAEQFSNVMFENNTGYKTAPNVSAYNARFHEARTVFGTIAARVSKSGIIGCIASFPIPEVLMSINALTVAARRIRPDAQVRVVWINKWFDPAMEASAAQALIDQGADVLTQITNSGAPTQIAEKMGVHSFGQDNDMSAFGPNAHLTGIINNWGPYYIQRVQDVLDGTWNSHSGWDGFAEGVIELAPYNSNLPDEVVQEAMRVKAGLTNGSIHPFSGPIRDVAGNEIVADGATLSDSDAHKMDWFAEGVQAELNN